MTPIFFCIFVISIVICTCCKRKIKNLNKKCLLERVSLTVFSITPIKMAVTLEVLTPGGLPTGASLLSGRHVALRCLNLMICILVYHCWGVGGGGRRGIGGYVTEVLTPGGLPTGASLLSGRHVALRCLNLMICILV